MKFDSASLQVYLVIGSQNVGGKPEEVLRIAREACAAGITALQYREKDGSKLNQQEKLNLGKELRTITAKYQVPLYVDDDLELALAIDADGIHVGQADTKVPQIKAAAPQLMLGLSVHNLDELTKSRSVLGQVDYLGVGPVFATNSKAQAKEPIGPAGLQEVCSQSPLPVVAIGGIKCHNADQVAGKGAAGIAVISAITASNNIAEIVKELKEKQTDEK
ncbi:thiamine phosphate synthase [Eupransor demetentiae]|uniref:Thiamine-phosphate synthase n=1 Tax=Eupransor demetentiae TaxID=3109584 RepID=A0ABP0EUP5_9LACO|nr:Thiamine monophosphate synthase (ThiE) [Lactobacillaceae bacterium LMG 33000]